MPSPQKQVHACFIFNRAAPPPPGARFVSYHFEAEVEITDQFPDVDQILRRLDMLAQEFKQ